jgi:hypothetical protein
MLQGWVMLEQWSKTKSDDLVGWLVGWIVGWLQHALSRSLPELFQLVSTERSL